MFIYKFMQIFNLSPRLSTTNAIKKLFSLDSKHLLTASRDSTFFTNHPLGNLQLHAKLKYPFGSSLASLTYYWKSFYTYYLSDLNSKTLSFGFTYVKGLLVILFIDACLTDDEPLWEPIEWSLVQTWILFIFTFAWIAENLIVSRYGSYTGRDKRVWMSWYKTFWLIEGYYVLNYGAACIFFIVPFYYETNYNLSFVYSWWHWYTRVFFF